jgi:transposase
LVVDKQKLGFRAIAVVAAIDLSGKVVALLTREKSICTDSFLEFLELLRKKMRGAKTFVFLDNLKIHHTHIIARKAESCSQVLVFNAPYSSHLNPIERLWALAKRQFIKDCVTDADFKSQEQIKGLVMKNILEAPAKTLEKHIYACLALMRLDIIRLRRVN